MDLKDTQEFYDDIAETYDWLFSEWKAVMNRQMEKLVPLFREKSVKKVLDCACGTGVQSIGLLQAGFEVLSSDISGKMLEQASRHAKEEGLNLETLRAGFRELKQKVPDQFDAVVCMGNSIPHLFSDQDIKDALLNMKHVLKPGGLFVVEIRDFDRLFESQEKFMVIQVNAEHGDNLVTILYDVEKTRPIARFHVIYIIQNKISKQYKLDVHSVDYYPIGNEKLRMLIQDAGFLNVKRRDDFEGFVWFIGQKE